MKRQRRRTGWYGFFSPTIGEVSLEKVIVEGDAESDGDVWAESLGEVPDLQGMLAKAVYVDRSARVRGLVHAPKLQGNARFGIAGRIWGWAGWD